MNILESLISLFLPRICHLCGEQLGSSERFVCHHCISKLPYTGYDKYWENNDGLNSDLNPMETRFAGQIPLNRAYAPFFYSRDSALSSLVQDFKYRGFSRLATHLGSLGAEKLVPSGFFSGVDLLIPVPLHWTKQLKRGYNQSLLIARGISDVTGIPVATNLKARVPHRTQTALSAEERIANTRDIFSVTDPSRLSDRHIMLVDDICTTGATLLSAADAIASAADNVRFSIFTLGVV